MTIIGAPTQTSTIPRRLVEMSADIRAAVLLDSAGGLVAASDDEPRPLADLAHQLVVAADHSAPDPTKEIEVQTGRGTVFVVRDERHTFACVASHAALASLVLFDLRHMLAQVR